MEEHYETPRRIATWQFVVKKKKNYFKLRWCVKFISTLLWTSRFDFTMWLVQSNVSNFNAISHLL